MGIFGARRNHSSQNYYRPVQQQRPAAPAAQPVARPAAPPAQTPAAPPAATPAPSGNPQSLISGLGNLFGGGGAGLQKLVDSTPMGELLRAREGVKLTPEERAQVQQAAGVMERLAGADGLWNRADLQNNVQQLERSGDLNRAVNSEINRRWGQELNSRGRLGQRFVNAHMNRNYGKYQAQGMNQARGMAKDQLGKGLNEAGVKGDAGHKADKTTPEGLKKSGEAISREEMEKMQAAMKMLQEKSEAQGLPKVEFKNGVPAQFLKDIAAGKSPQEALKDAGAVLKLKSGKEMDLSKMPSLGGGQKPEEKAAEKAAEGSKEAVKQAGEAAAGATGGQAGGGASGATSGGEAGGGASGATSGGEAGAQGAGGSEGAGEAEGSGGSEGAGASEGAESADGAEGAQAEEGAGSSEEAGGDDAAAETEDSGGAQAEAAEPEPEPEPVAEGE